MKIYTASIRFDPIEDVTALREIVRKQYPKNNPGRYAVVGDSLIVANSFTDDTDNVKKMGAIIGNTFNRQVDIHFDELNFDLPKRGEGCNHPVRESGECR